MLPKTRTVASANGSAALPAATSIDWQRLALDREDGGDLTGALAADTCALTLDDSDGRTYYHRAQIQTALKNYRAALEDYQRAIDQEFNQPFVYFEQALTLRAAGEVQKAMEILGKVSEQKADDSLKSQALENLSILRLQYPNLKPSIPDLQPVARDFDAAVQLARKFPGVYYNRGVFRLLQTDYSGARQDFKMAHALKSKNDPGNLLLDLLLDPVAYDPSTSELTIAFIAGSDNAEVFTNSSLPTGTRHSSNSYRYIPALKTLLPNLPYLFIYANTPSESLDWRPYMEQLQAQVKNHWKTQKAQTKMTTIVQFDVISSGAVENLRVVASSGNKDSDSAAIEAINAASPFNLLPPQYTNREEGKRKIKIKFTFDINVKKQ